MSKERLEDFREFIDFMYESLDIEDHQRFVAISESMIKDGWFKWIYRYAKEQAERVQELEELAETDGSAFLTLENLFIESEQQNKRYRETINKIKKYANDCIDVEVEMNPYLVIDDIKALEGEE